MSADHVTGPTRVARRAQRDFARSEEREQGWGDEREFERWRSRQEVLRARDKVVHP